MKRTKLIMSIIACCFALSVLAFGVYASLSVSFNLSGKISFDPHGVDATITTQVFKYKEGIDQEQAYLKACELQVEDFDTLVSKGYENLTTKQTYLTKEGNTYNQFLEQDLSDSVLNFEDCEAYFIVVHVLPSESYSLEEHNQIVFVELTQQDLPEENVWLAYNDKYLAIYPSAQDSGFNMVFFIGITEPYKQVDEHNFSLTLSFEYKDIYVPTSKDTFSKDIFKLGQKVENIVIPEKYNSEIITEINISNSTFSGQCILPKNFTLIKSIAYFSSFEAIVTQDNENCSSLDGSLYNKTKNKLIKYKYDQNPVVYMHDFVEELNISVFLYNKNIKNIYLSERLTSLPSISDFFMGCSNIQYNLDEVYGGKYLPSKRNPYFALMDVDGTKQYNTDFVLNKNCKVLGESACTYSDITSFDFNGVDIKVIPSNMFYKCSSLTNITIPDSVIRIEGGAFASCENLNYNLDDVYGGKYLPSKRNPYFALVHIDDTKTYDTNFVLNENCKILGGNACASSNITSFDFHDVDIKEIPELMFVKCKSLTSLTIPDSVTSIRNGVFQGANISSIFIPASVQTMETSVFTVAISNFKIYCEAVKQPAGWSSGWAYKNLVVDPDSWPVTWGVTREQYLQAIGQ